MRIVVTGGIRFLGSARSLGYDVTRAETPIDILRGTEALFHLAALVQSRIWSKHFDG
jgi:hypothetical protein